MNAAYEAKDGYLYVKVTGEFNLIRARSLLSEWMKKEIHALAIDSTEESSRDSTANPTGIARDAS